MWTECVPISTIPESHDDQEYCTVTENTPLCWVRYKWQKILTASIKSWHVMSYFLCKTVFHIQIAFQLLYWIQNFFVLFFSSWNEHFALMGATSLSFLTGILFLFFFLQCTTSTAVKYVSTLLKLANKEMRYSHLSFCHLTWLGRLLRPPTGFKRRGLLLAWIHYPTPNTAGFGESVVLSIQEVSGQAPGVGWLLLVSSNTARLKKPTAASRFTRAMLSLGMTTCARSLVMREISWATHTKMKVLTKMLSEGFPGIRTKIPLVSAASQMWYWQMNSWGRQSRLSVQYNVWIVLSKGFKHGAADHHWKKSWWRWSDTF